MNIGRYILGVLLLLAFQCMPAQDIEGNTVVFRLSNLPEPDVEEADLLQGEIFSIVSPQIQNGDYYSSDNEEVEIFGKVNPDAAISLLSINSEMVEINQSGAFTTILHLEPGENRIKVSAMDSNDRIREKILIFYNNQPVITLANRIRQESKYYGLIIGIDNYRDPELSDLDNPIRDSEKLFVSLTGDYSFESENVIYLKDATRREIIGAFDELATRISKNDNLLIFYAGHGWWDENANNGYWLPSDAQPWVKANWVRNSTVVDYLKEINSHHTLLIADACFGGSIFKTRSAFGNKNMAFEKLYDLPSRKAMTSGTLTEVPDRSSFTRYLVQRLNDNKETFLSSEQLFSSFRIAVINNSDAIPQFGEISNVGDQGGDFIFLKRK